MEVEGYCWNKSRKLIFIEYFISNLKLSNFMKYALKIKYGTFFKFKFIKIDIILQISSPC